MAQRFTPLEMTAVRDADGHVLGAMTVDVEDYYHAHALESFFTRDTWPDLPRRVAENTARLLDMFDESGVKGTFFTLGTVAREYPGLVRDIVDRGHELASHGLEHYRASDQDSATFRKDVTAAKSVLEDAGGVEVKGYRAASFSIGEDNWWAFDVLEEAGYTYSSSVSAGRVAGPEMKTPETPFTPGSGRLVECPITTITTLGRAVPTGGGYFRLMPYGMFRRALEGSIAHHARGTNFYFHPWEIDPGQPRARVRPRTQFRHRVNLDRMEHKIARVLKDFRWGRMTDVFGSVIP